jgi:hypothetical protein
MIFYSLTSPEKYLYHYTTSCALLCKILPNHSLRMNSLAQTNDPREFKSWKFDLGTNRRFTEESEDEWEGLEKETTLAKDSFKVVCFTTDSPNSVGGPGVGHIWERGFCKPRMWAQYAEKAGQMGVCLVFDRAELESSLRASVPRDTRIFKDYVEYRNGSQPRSLENDPFILDYDLLKRHGNEKAIQAHVEYYWKELFFQKATDWSHEAEYRYLLWDRQKDAHIFSFGGALKGIVLGLSFSQEKLDELRRYYRYGDLDIVQLNWRNRNPEVRSVGPVVYPHKP